MSRISIYSDVNYGSSGGESPELLESSRVPASPEGIEGITESIVDRIRNESTLQLGIGVKAKCTGVCLQSLTYVISKKVTAR